MRYRKELNDKTDNSIKLDWDLCLSAVECRRKCG